MIYNINTIKIYNPDRHRFVLCGFFSNNNGKLGWKICIKDKVLQKCYIPIMKMENNRIYHLYYREIDNIKDKILNLGIFLKNFPGQIRSISKSKNKLEPGTVYFIIPSLRNKTDISAVLIAHKDCKTESFGLHGQSWEFYDNFLTTINRIYNIIEIEKLTK